MKLRIAELIFSSFFILHYLLFKQNYFFFILITRGIRNFYF